MSSIQSRKRKKNTQITSCQGIVYLQVIFFCEVFDCDIGMSFINRVSTENGTELLLMERSEDLISAVVMTIGI
jgi:hypothetical protein